MSGPDVSEPDRPSGEMLRRLREMESRFAKKAPQLESPITLKDVADVHERMLEQDKLPDEPVVVRAVQPPPMTATEVLEGQERLAKAAQRELGPAVEKLTNILVPLRVRLYAGDVLIAESADTGLFIELAQRMVGRQS